MINDIISFRRQGMSFRKIAQKLNSTVGKVHYQWTKNLQVESKQQIAISHQTLHKILERKTLPEQDYFLVSQLESNQKIVSFWEIALWQKQLLTSYFNKDINQDLIILRLYDVTDLYFNGSNAHSYYEFQLKDTARNWTIKGIKQGRCYVTEIGYKIKNHQFFPILRSNTVHNLPIKMDERETPSLDENAVHKEQTLRPKWVGKVSTYSYYENINEENDING